MFDFVYYTPTKVLFGKESEKKVGEIMSAQQCSKVLIHYSNTARRTGLLELVETALKEKQISFVELGGVRANPQLSLVREGIELCRKEKVDFVLAIGGGSAIDSSKAIACGTPNTEDIWEIWKHGTEITKGLPVGVILTIAAAGSEMSKSAVIVHDGEKVGYDSDFCRPRFSILDPQLTMTLSDFQTACGCVDIMMHTMERYFTSHPSMEITDSISEALLRTVIKNAKILKEDPQNYEARAEIMWAGSLAHNDLTGCGNDGGDFVTHMMEGPLSGRFNTVHGAGLAAIWCSWARYVYKDCLPKFKRYALNVMQVSNTGSDEEIARKGIEETEMFYHTIGVPVSITEMGIHPSDEELEDIAGYVSNGGTVQVGSAKALGKEELLEIYKRAR